ncbi:uncharacterized protein LOC106469698 [Limulus polyphemus]|uniref:Uncharacterized protein LOC106469698 n=1 Tax=Limulus polyphemus TaxID=6850 RepID=A0ABM1BNN4_LIMPO|nr:uncharacterized protein LOC106469698 [Limulus polyphemus]
MMIAALLAILKLTFYTTCLSSCFTKAATVCDILCLADNFTVKFSPPYLLELSEQEIKPLVFSIEPKSSCQLTEFNEDIFSEARLEFSILPEDENVVKVAGSEKIILNISDIFDGKNSTLFIEGKFLGFTTLLWTVSLTTSINENETSLFAEPDGTVVTLWDGQYFVTVSRSESPSQILFVIILGILVVINNINMGCHIDVSLIIDVLKKPVAPLIGLASQFFFMPLASFGFGLLLFNDLTWRLGLFTLGCSPGGTMSNFWNIIFHGDVSLSVIMTFISTIAALGFIPLWMSTLGSQMLPLGELSIPFEKLVTSLIGLTIPIGIGILIQRFKPRWADFSRKIIRPFTLICVAISLVSGIYSYYYVILLFNWRVVVAGMAVAWGGFFFGAIFSWIFRLSRPQVIAVAFETALQNASIAFILLQLSLPQPFADLAVVPLAAQLLMTGAPLYLLFAVYVLYHKFVKKDKKISSLFEDPEGGKSETTSKEDEYSEERRPLLNNRNRETVEPKEETTTNNSRGIENVETATLRSSRGKESMELGEETTTNNSREIENVETATLRSSRGKESMELEEETTMNNSRGIENVETATLRSSRGRENTGLEEETISHENSRIVKNDNETEETFLRNRINDNAVNETEEEKS